MTTDDLRTRAREAAMLFARESLRDTKYTPTEVAATYWQAYMDGFLAHAAQQPTREQIARAIGDAANPTQVGFGVVGIEAATTAVLALFDGAGS